MVRYSCLYDIMLCGLSRREEEEDQDPSISRSSRIYIGLLKTLYRALLYVRHFIFMVFHIHVLSNLSN
jgi:hypothetical protein